jgi:hypothetical protein
MNFIRPRRAPRGQNMVLFALTLLLVTVMAMMTLSITSRVRQKLELQTVADVSAYNDAVSTARGMNTLGIINRTVVSHWVAMLGVQANMAYATQVPAFFDSFATQLDDMRFYTESGGDPKCPNPNDEKLRLKELLTARDAFMHASFSLWTKGGPNDDVSVPGCAGCFARVTPGLGELDRDVTLEVKAVRGAVRDLVEVQRDLNGQLLKSLQQQTGPKSVAAASMGQPYATSTFPLAVQSAISPASGSPLPPGAREVTAALGTSRDAVRPMAHAAMGSRTSLFTISGALETGNNQFSVYTPVRALRYTNKISNALNNLFPKQGFQFSLSNQMIATWLTQFGADDEDPLWTMQPGAPPNDPSDVSPPETIGPIQGGPPVLQVPQNYAPGLAWRMTPGRNIGFDFAGGKEAGSIAIVFRGPCGTDKRSINVISFSRTHAGPDTYGVTQHEWESGQKKLVVANSGPDPDGARDYNLLQPQVLHGVNRSGQGYDTAGHRLTFLCHPWHRHTNEIDDATHSAGPVVDNGGLMPGGFGFIFPQGASSDDGSGGAFGQPKVPVLFTRANSGGGLTPDPWNLKLNFSFSRSGGGAGLDLAKEQSDLPMAVLSTGIAYYHRRCQNFRRGDGQQTGKPSSCGSWLEPPNLLNPFWHATLAPIDVDEKLPAKGDSTPGLRYPNEARKMFQASNLDDAAETYRLLVSGGYEGIQ